MIFLHTTVFVYAGYLRKQKRINWGGFAMPYLSWSGVFLRKQCVNKLFELRVFLEF